MSSSENLFPLDYYYRALPAVYIVFIAISCVLVLGIGVMTLRIVFIVHYCVPNEHYQGDLYFIVWMPLFVSVVCLVGNIIPRAAAFLYAVGLVYLMMCLHISIVLIVRLFGSRKQMCDWLITNEKVFLFDVRPYCCCCHCLPPMKPTPRRLRYLSYLVKQSPIVRTFLQILIVVITLEGIRDAGTTTQVLNGIGVASTLIAVFICHVIVTASRDHLEDYNMFVIFRCVDVSQMLFTFQKFILDLIAKNGGMGGLSVAPPSMISRFWHNIAMTFELTIVCFILYRNVRPGKSKFFTETSVQRSNGNAVPLTDL
ncbi:unnamed protein product [Auanema sp. JU1783]|nr:unnamed protein product [Auanema sp. JU1783]